MSEDGSGSVTWAPPLLFGSGGSTTLSVTDKSRTRGGDGVFSHVRPDALVNIAHIRKLHEDEWGWEWGWGPPQGRGTGTDAALLLLLGMKDHLLRLQILNERLNSFDRKLIAN